jgi:hypothetical protein
MLGSVQNTEVYIHSHDKRSIKQKEDSVHQHIGLKCEEDTGEMLFLYGAET